MVCSAIAAGQAQQESASAQRVSFGVLAGGYTSSDFDSKYVTHPGFLPDIVRSGSGGYIIGPFVAVRLFQHLSLGVEALYKPLHYSAAASFLNGVPIGFARAAVVTWQFPILARYKFPLGRVNPFLEGGPSFRTAGNLNSSDPSHVGVSAGVGVETEWRRFRVAPRVRYTRWANDSRFADVRTRADQLEFLLGIGYDGSSNVHPLGRRVSIGAVIGANLPDQSHTATEATYQATWGPRRLVLGPLVELSLTPRFSVEGNALSRSSGITTRVTTGPGQVWKSASSWADPWEFPLLVKYRLSTGSYRPFLALGPSFRLSKEIAGAWLSNYGAAAGVGLEMRMKRIRIAPALRYTHWGPDRSRVLDGPADSGVSRNQVQLLVGISFF